MNRLLNNLEPSFTLELNQLAKTMVQQGKSVINLTAGEPDFNTPERILIAAQKAMKDGKTKYTHAAGIPELRLEICNHINRQYKRDYSPNEVVVTNGGKQAIFNLCYALLNQGDEVLIPDPSWVSYRSMVEMVGAIPVTVPSGIEKKFEPDLEALESKISPKTKLLILNSPNNPSGAVFSKDFFTGLEFLLQKHSHLFVLTDDIYEKFVYDNREFYSIAMSPKVSKDRLIIVTGVSKAYSMTGWRIGYAIGPKEVISVMSNIQSQTTSNACSISQWAALEALKGSTEEEFTQFKTLFQQRRDLAFESFSKIDGVKCIKPEGAFYIFPNVSHFMGRKTPNGKLIQNDIDLAYYLLNDKGVATVPGTAFGLPGHVRCSFVVSFDTWNEGARRFAKGLAELRQ